MKKRFVFAIIIGLIATCIISFIQVAVNVGFNDRFLLVWLRSWGIAYLVVIPLLLFLAPEVHRLVNRMMDER